MHDAPLKPPASGETTVPGEPSGAGRREWAALGLLLLAALFLFGWGLGSYPLWDPWEPKYAHTIREMSGRGDFITPFLDGEIRWTKPILIYWVMAASTLVLGDNELAVRLPSVLSALLAVGLVYYALRRLRGPTSAFTGAAVLVTLPQFFYMARQAMPDMLLTACLAGAMGFLALARFSTVRREGHLIAFWASVALGFLTKGPLAIVMTLWAVLLFLLPEARVEWLNRPSRTLAELRRLWTRYRVGRGILVFLALAGPWYGAMLGIHGRAFIDNFIIDENVKRFSEPLFGHVGITSRYVTTLAHGAFPWTGLLAIGLLFLFRGHGSDRIDEEMRLRWYFASWLLGGFSIFTTAGTKLDHYLLPVMPAVAALIALAWEAWFRDEPPWWVRPGLLVSVLVVFLPFRDFVFEGDRYIMSVFSPAQDIERMELGIERTLWAVFVAWIAVTAVAWLRPGCRWVARAALLVAFVHGVYFCHIALPAHTPERNLKAYAEEYAAIAPEGAELDFYGWIRYSIHYYHGSDYRYFEPDELNELVEYVHGRSDVYIVAQDLFFDEMLDELHRVTRQRWTTVAGDHPLFTLITNRKSARLRSAAGSP